MAQRKSNYNPRPRADYSQVSHRAQGNLAVAPEVLPERRPQKAPVVVPRTRQQAKPKTNPLVRLMAFAMVSAVFVVGGLVVMRSQAVAQNQTKINTLRNEENAMKIEIGDLQAQYNMAQSLDTVQARAKELGMEFSKADQLVALEKPADFGQQADTAVPTVNTEGESFWDYLLGLFH